MNDERDPATIAREIVDDSLYLVVSTADRSGQPWASPVYFAHSGYREFFWVSAPEAAHSRNLRERRKVGIVIFDSRAPINTGQGVYISGVAQELPAHECEEPVAIFSKRSVGHGGGRVDPRGCPGAGADAPLPRHRRGGLRARRARPACGGAPLLRDVVMPASGYGHGRVAGKLVLKA